MFFQNLCLFNESFIFFSKLIDFIIKAYLGLQKKWNRKYKKFSNIHFPTCTVFSIIHILHWYGTFVTIDALLLIKAHSLHSLCVVQVHGFVKSIMSCIYWYSIIQNSFTALKIPCAPMYASSPHLPSPWQPLIFLLSIVLPFPECYIAGIIWYVAFLDLLLSLFNMHLRFLYVFLCLDNSSIFINV